MRIARLMPLLLALAGPALAAPPREQSPADPAALASVGEGNSDAALAEVVAAAAAFPLGSRDNPVRVAGPDGAEAYLARLRCADGSRPMRAAAGSGGTGGFGTVTQRHVVDCGRAAPGRAELHFDLYHEGHVEDRAPAGLTLQR